MAEIRKSIAIDVKADMKKLLGELSKIPNMTKQEAKKMVSQLTSELKRAENAAKKAAKTTRKAGKEMASGYELAEQKARQLRSTSRGLNRSMTGLEDTVGLINPELEGMAVQLSMAAQGSRALMNSLASGNPIIIALTVAVAAAVAAYTIFTASSKKNTQAQVKLNAQLEAIAESMKEVNTLFEKAEGVFLTNAQKVNAVTLQYQMMSGAITQAEFEQLKLEKSIGDMEESLNKANEEKIASLKVELLLQKQLSNAESERMDSLIDAGKAQEITRDGTARATKEFKRSAAAREEAEERIISLRTELTSLEKEGTERIKSQVEAYREAAVGLAEIEKQNEESEKREKRRQKFRESAEKRRVELESILVSMQEKNANLLDSIRTSEMSRMTARDQIIEKYELEEEKIQSIADETLKQLEQAKQIASVKNDSAQLSLIEEEREKILLSLEQRRAQFNKESAQELHDLEKKLGDQRIKEQEKREQEQQKLREQAQKQLEAGADATLQGMKQFTTGSLQLMKNLGGENKGIINALFRAQQAFAVADIVMSTARAIARAPADYGPFAPFAIPAIAAGGAAQIAVVASQSPPEMHMGGMLKGEDTQTITALRGEAVLDRRTVSRLGGEQGVNRLQRGESQQDRIVVVQPFKHFDRYVNFSKKRGGSLARISPKNTTGAY